MADYISREAVLELIDNAPIIAGNENETLISAPKLSDEVYCIPAADVRPVVRARWEDETGYIFNLLAQRVYCPACKSHAYFYPITTKNFCPNCGAEMEK